MTEPGSQSSPTGPGFSNTLLNKLASVGRRHDHLKMETRNRVHCTLHGDDYGRSQVLAVDFGLLGSGRFLP
eukprot:2248994-Rhodomonas_salina.2